MMIDIKKDKGVYVIYIDGAFYGTCENMKEVGEELENIAQEREVI